MLAFILTDLFSSGNSFLRGTANLVGTINGEPITREEFGKKLEGYIEQYKQSTGDIALERATTIQFVEQVWNELKRDHLLAGIVEPNGFEIGESELYLRIIDNPNIRGNQTFADPNTGQFSEARFSQAVANLRDNQSDPQAAEMWKQWVDFEKAVRDQAKSEKVYKAIEKALIWPKALAEADNNRNNQNIKVKLIAMRFDQIADSTIAITDADIRDHVRRFPQDFERKDQREITFVNFPIQASDADRESMKAELSALLTDRFLPGANGANDTIEGFASTEEDSLFVSANSDLPYDPGFYPRTRLSPLLDSTLWNMPVGQVFGPFEEDGMLQLAKVVKRISLPDSAKARHILIAYQGAERAAPNITRSPVEAKELADSLLAYVKADRTRFAQVNEKYSDDAVAKTKGGDLGWFQQNSMAKEFGDYCFYNKKGDFGLVITNFGFHLVEVSDQKGGTESIRVARVAKKVAASEQTINDVYRKASDFASGLGEAGLGDKAASMNLEARPAKAIEAMTENIPGLGNNRELVRWAFQPERKEGDVQLFTNGTASYTVVQLDQILKKGLPTPDEFPELYKERIIKEKKQKETVAKLEAAAKGATDLEAVAAALGMSDRIFEMNLGFMQVNVQGIGGEPDWCAYLSGLPLNRLSKAFPGERASYMGVVVDRPAPMPGDVQTAIDQAERQVQGRLRGGLTDALEKSGKVVDNRAVHY
jgi:peptidyl-prolyl cis-trans isomerase D